MFLIGAGFQELSHSRLHKYIPNILLIVVIYLTNLASLLDVYLTYL